MSNALICFQNAGPDPATRLEDATTTIKIDIAACLKRIAKNHLQQRPHQQQLPRPLHPLSGADFSHRI